MEQCAALKRILEEADWDVRKFFQQFVYWKNYVSKHPECVKPPMSDDSATWKAACDALAAIPPQGNPGAQRQCYEYALERMGCAVAPEQ